MAPPHYEMVFQQYDELCTVYGMICSVDGLAAETCGDISSNAGLVGKWWNCSICASSRRIE